MLAPLTRGLKQGKISSGVGFVTVVMKQINCRVIEIIGYFRQGYRVAANVQVPPHFQAVILHQQTNVTLRVCKSEIRKVT